jgi:hypothetical protein
MRFIRVLMCACPRPLTTYRFEAGAVFAIDGASGRVSSWFGTAALTITFPFRKSPLLSTRFTATRSTKRVTPFLETNFLVPLNTENNQSGTDSPTNIELFAKAAFWHG